jgi:hypothetical protein
MQKIPALQNSFYYRMKQKGPIFEGGDSACRLRTPLHSAKVLLLPFLEYRIGGCHSGGGEPPGTFKS